MFPRKRSLGVPGGRPFWESLEEFQTYLPPHPSFLELTPPPPAPINFAYCESDPHTIAVETTNSLATKLLIVPKFTSYFIYSRVYNIGVFYSRLLHSISIHACYCYGTALSRPMLCRPKSEFFAYSQNIDTLESFTVIFFSKKVSTVIFIEED